MASRRRQLTEADIEEFIQHLDETESFLCSDSSSSDEGKYVLLFFITFIFVNVKVHKL